MERLRAILTVLPAVPSAQLEGRPAAVDRHDVFVAHAGRCIRLALKRSSLSSPAFLHARFLSVAHSCSLPIGEIAIDLPNGVFALQKDCRFRSTVAVALASTSP